LKFQTSIEVEQLTGISLVRVWFVNAVLALQSRTRVWWSWRFFALSTRLSPLRIERESGGLRVFRLLNVVLVYHKIRVWVSRLGQFSKFGVQTRASCELRVSIIGRGSMCWALHLSSNILTCFCLCEI